MFNFEKKKTQKTRKMLFNKSISSLEDGLDVALEAITDSDQVIIFHTVCHDGCLEESLL